VSGLPGLRPLSDSEVVGVAVGGAGVSALLSLVAPYLVSLTGALSAIAFAGWVATRADARGGVRPSLRPVAWLVLTGLAVGAVLFLAPPGPMVRFRALPLGAALVPLWKISPRGNR
jgi:hypothetical protein